MRKCMENKKIGGMGLVKASDTALNNFFGKKETSSKDEFWRVSLMFTKEDEKICRAGFKALPRDKRAMRDYQKEAILEQARKDIARGELLQKAMEDLDK